MAALTFKTSLDDSDFTKGLKHMEQTANNTATQISTKLRNAMSATGKKEAGMGRGAHGGLNGLGDALNAVTGSSGAVGQLNAIKGALGATAGAAIGIYAGVKAFEALHDAVGDARKAGEDANGAFKQLNATIVAGGEGAIEKEIEGNNKLIEKLKETRTWKLKLVDAFTLGNRGLTSERQGIAIQKQNIDLQHQGVDAIKQRTDEIRNSITLTERDRKLAESKRKLDEDLSKATGPMGASLAERARAEAEVRDKMINHEAQSKKDEMQLERNILEIRRKGGETEDNILAEKKRFAESQMKKATNDDEYQSQLTKRDEAETELVENKRQREEKFEQERVQANREEISIYLREWEDANNKLHSMRSSLAKQEASGRLSSQKKTAEAEAEEWGSGLSLLEQERQRGIDRSKMSAHDRSAMRRQQRKDIQAENRFDRRHPGMMEDIRRVRDLQNAAKKEANRVQAVIDHASIMELTEAFNKLVMK